KAWRSRRIHARAGRDAQTTSAGADAGARRARQDAQQEMTSAEVKGGAYAQNQRPRHQGHSRDHAAAGGGWRGGVRREHAGGDLPGVLALWLLTPDLHGAEYPSVVLVAVAADVLVQLRLPRRAAAMSAAVGGVPVRHAGRRRVWTGQSGVRRQHHRWHHRAAAGGAHAREYLGAQTAVAAADCETRRTRQDPEEVNAYHVGRTSARPTGRPKP